MSKVSPQLPKLPKITQISPCVTRLLALNPGSFTLQGTNTYLLGAPTTRKRLLIDTGIGLNEYRDMLVDYLADNDLELEAILVTHWHVDHWGGLDTILEKIPDVTLYKYKLPTPLGEDEVRFNFQHAGDNDTIETCGIRLTPLFTPGHCDDHICLWLHDEQTLFSADNVLGHGSTIFNDYTRYMRSLHQMLALPNLGLILPGHGELIKDGPAKIRDYIDHRRAREEELFVLLSGNERPQSSIQLMQKVYTDIRTKPARIQMAALNNTNQYLAQLRKDHKVRNTPDGLWIALDVGERSGL